MSKNYRSLLSTSLLLFANVFLGWLSVIDAIDSRLTIGDLGELIGTIEETEWSGRSVYKFLGIPYAEPPIANLRYRPPVKITSWNETINATSYGSPCPQSGVVYSEDCLTLNVFVPEREDETQLLPVMVFIHGGTFRAGYASLYQPLRFLDDQDLIVVVPQYRLGFLGLFSIETDDVPGNVQFLDQIMALNWIQDNIVHFGGDNSRVTLYGHSSGAASVHFHLLSPLTEGLFHQTILQSGSALRTYGVDEHPRESAFILADYCGCRNITEPDEIAYCMRELTVENIVDCTTDYLAETIYDGLTRARSHMAVVQKAGDQKFLIDNPKDLLARGEFHKLPMIAGVTRNDGSLYLKDIYSSILVPNGWENDTDYARNNLTGYVLKYLGIQDITGTVEQAMTKFYLSEDELGDFVAMAPGLIDICSTVSYKSGSYETVKANMIHRNSYVYTFNYKIYEVETTSQIYPFETRYAHGDDTMLLFPRYDYQRENDVEMAKVLLKLWTSFVINGVPEMDGITWPVMSTSVGPYLVLDNEISQRDNFVDEFVTSKAAEITIIKKLSTICYSLIIITVVYALTGCRQ